MEFLNDKNTAEYEEFIQGHKKGNIMQSVLWARLKDNWTREGVIVRGDDQKIKGTMLLLIRKVPALPYTIMYSPRGPVCDVHDEKTFMELVAGAKALAKKHKSYVLKMDTDVLSSDAEYERIARAAGFTVSDSKNFEGIQPRYVFRLNVEGKTEDEVMAMFHSKTRYNIRVAKKHGVETKIEGVERIPDFYRIMLETGVRDNFMIRSEGYFKKMMESLGEHCRLYMAYYEGKPIAGTLALHYGDKVWYLYGASSNEYRNVMPNYLLQWEMIRWSIETGCRIYDFRGVSGDISEDNPLYGLYRFKKGFGGDFCEFIGELNLVFSPFINFAITKGERVFRRMRKQVFIMKNK
ncbi:MAG: peptidoglycan bridge formation glycyltransferase FemA/FemB family protein [Clostridia bacterium]|nr:peptidoglycan bridge formation glycyltransferase FemA/FemB family protein [Clostridia bacterium]